MKRTNPGVDAFILRAKSWKRETAKLRNIILDCGLSEELKWGKPCYTFQNSNIVIIQDFKEYCALLFFKGVLLKDPGGILVKTGEHTRVGRQARFFGLSEIVKREALLKACIKEAIEVEKAGLKVELKKDAPLILPEEFKKKLADHPALKTAFHALTPGRQRAYNIYFSSPKQSKTRESRIEKSLPQILRGKGLNDR